MVLGNPINGGQTLEEPPNSRDGGKSSNLNPFSPFSDEIDSNCSTPYVSAPSSPGRNPSSSNGYFFSAPASPMHYVLSSAPLSALATGGVPAGSSELLVSGGGSFEFDGANPGGSMTSADELFHNGQIRPMKLSSHLQRPQSLAPLLDLKEEEEDEAKDSEMSGRGREIRLRSRSVHRRARSMSPMRNSRFQWQYEDEDEEEEEEERKDLQADPGLDVDPKENEVITPSDSSASSSRSSSSGRNSKRWIFLKDLLYRSKSEGRGRTNGKDKEKEKFWHSISFSPSISKERGKSSKPPSILAEKSKPAVNSSATPLKRPMNAVGKRRGPLPSAHERHYTANRAQAEEMRKRTFLPYRQGLFGCLGFSSRSYSAMKGLAKTLNPVSSR